jgi:hypothetical protein
MRVFALAMRCASGLRGVTSGAGRPFLVMISALATSKIPSCPFPLEEELPR